MDLDRDMSMKCPGHPTYRVYRLHHTYAKVSLMSEPPRTHTVLRTGREPVRHHNKSPERDYYPVESLCLIHLLCCLTSVLDIGYIKGVESMLGAHSLTATL